jgi:lathosterol oxidase
VPLLWAVHKHHHAFYNPTPFSVISDEAADQLVRTLPLILIPLAVPTNMDLLFAQFAIFFYGYGVYLHWGFESAYLSAHQSVINGAYEHWYHHALSAGGTTYYTGFFFKLWDNMAATVNKGPCICARCEVAAGRRDRAAWDKVVKPDYSVLLTPGFWLNAAPAPAGGAEPKVSSSKKGKAAKAL